MFYMLGALECYDDSDTQLKACQQPELACWLSASGSVLSLIGPLAISYWRDIGNHVLNSYLASRG